jgi:hypothetical protein
LGCRRKAGLTFSWFNLFGIAADPLPPASRH